MITTELIGSAFLEAIAALDECDAYLDNYADILDGSDGQPVPNRAMQLQARIRETIEMLQRLEEHR